MKNKIKRISKGDFEVEQSDIQFSETRIVMRVGEGEKYEGSFTLQNRLDGDIRGLVYPSSFRVHCKEQGFEGNPVVIHYTFDGSNMAPGDVEEGKFSIVCNGGEYEIAFTAITEKPFVITEYGKIQNIKDFKKLAMTDFAEAQKLFRAKKFTQLLKYEDDRMISLYSNMRKWSLDEQALEEFLVASKQKERIYLLFQEEEAQLGHYMETKKEVVVITKNTWGYLPVTFHVVGDFLKVDRREITTDDFVGANYYLEYLVDAEKLHAGYNYGKIVMETPYEKREYKVTVHQQARHSEHHDEEKLFFGGLLKSYMSCVSGKMSLNVWTDQAIELVKQLRELAPKNEFYELLMAHVFLRGGRAEEGRWLLENYNYNRFAIGKKVEIGAYYLFLTGLLSKEEVHVKKIVDELNKTYAKHPDSWMLLCMLINLDPQYRNYSERIHVLRQQFFNGANHILLYIEAYICYQEKGSLLKKLGAFELQVLNFATKYNIITEEIALYTASLASQEKAYNERLYQILARAYKLYENPMILTAVCTLLIKGDKKGRLYFAWYRKAVDAELKIAKLYEYYMMSVNTQRMMGPLPRNVVLYFAHGNSLDYKKTAFLYANVLTYEEETSELFANYNEKIEAFAWEQLQKCHIDENLRIIYKRFCSQAGADMERMKAVYDISHTYHIKTDAPNIKYVLVLEKNGTISQRAAYSEEGAQVILYHKSSRIIWESGSGRHYADSIPYEAKRLFYESQFVEMYKEKETLLEKAEEEPVIELSLEHLKQYGIDYFEEEQVFRFISREVRETEEADDDLCYFCFELLKRGQYDKMTLTYLSRYYCGATGDMKKVWYAAREYEVKTHKLSERIITQMLFSETVFHEEAIFADYYNGGAYFRLKLAYLSFAAREYVVKNRDMKEEIIQIMLREHRAGETLADVCKIAVLKFFAGQEYPEELEPVLKSFLHELCERQLVFPFYMNYRESWLREVLLHDKVLISYQAREHGKVKLVYKMDCERSKLQEQHIESLAPMYEDIYVKQFVLFEGERLQYAFKEYCGRRLAQEESGVCVQKRVVEPIGKYGQLNQMSRMGNGLLYDSLQKYQVEEQLAEEIFVTY